MYFDVDVIRDVTYLRKQYFASRQIIKFFRCILAMSYSVPVICSSGNIQQMSFDEKWKPQLYLACVTERKKKDELPFHGLPSSLSVIWRAYSLNNWRPLTAAHFLTTNTSNQPWPLQIFACPRTPSFQFPYKRITGLWTVKALNVEVTKELLTFFIPCQPHCEPPLIRARWQNRLPSPLVVFDRRRQQNP